MHTIRPALCYGICTKKDSGYNFRAFIGAEVFRKHNNNTSLSEYNFITNESCNLNFLRLAAEKRNNPIICLTSEYKYSLQIAAEEFPNTHFTILNAVIDLPNVQSIVLDSYGGTFLAGMAAGMATKSNLIGVSLIDFNFSHRDISGFFNGVQFVNKQAKLIKKMMDGKLGDYCNFDAGHDVAINQIAAGADIIFTPISQANYGALLAAKNTGKLYVGSHVNQNYAYPNGVLTSFICHIDKVVYALFLESAIGKWKAGVKQLSLKDGIFDWALDRFNRELISDEMESRINQAKADIMCGKLKASDPSSLGGTSSKLASIYPLPSK